MCEVSAVPKIGHKIESMEFLESLGKLFNPLNYQGFNLTHLNFEKIFKNGQKHLPKLC